jgi:signal transduction histidine kinase/HAMP domain-containing protein
LNLSGKYAITLVTLIFGVVLAFAGIILFQFRAEIDALNTRSAAALGDSVLKEIEEKEILTTRILAAALTNPLYRLDMPKINELLDAVRKQPNIRYVYVYDEKRRIIHDGTRELLLYDKVLDDELTSRSMRLAGTYTHLDKDLLHIATPINLQNDILGGVRMGFDLNKILSDIARQQQELDANYRDAAANQLYMIGIIAVTFSLCGLVASVALARSWSKPIVFLSHLTARIGKGDYNVEIPFERSDEIGDLAIGFREMVHSLKSLRQKESEQAAALLGANAQLHQANDVLKSEIIERKRAEEEVLRQHRRISSLHEIGAAINSTLDQRLLLDALFAKLRSLLPYSAVSVCWYDPELGRLVSIAERILTSETSMRKAESSGDGPALQLSEILVKQEDSLVIEDADLDARSALCDLLQKNRWKGFVGLPLSVEGKVLGALAFYLREPHQFPPEEVEFLATLASQVAIAIFNSVLYENSRKQAIDLEKAIHAKDEFLNVMSHELRTPLSVIGGYAQAMSVGVVGEISAEQQKITEKIIVQSNELLRMINEILQVGSLQAGSVQAYLQNTNLKDLFSDLQGTFGALPKGSIELNWEIPEHMPVVKTDGDKLKHVLQNLIHNAMKFTEHGSVTLSARCSDAYIEMTVKDTGIGIEQEKLPVIFDMFRQVDSSKTRSHGGVGVGLFIVKKYVELLNGKIEVESVPGRGTAFTLKIPVDDFAPPPKQHSQDQPARLIA